MRCSHYKGDRNPVKRRWPKRARILSTYRGPTDYSRGAIEAFGEHFLKKRSYLFQCSLQEPLFWRLAWIRFSTRLLATPYSRVGKGCKSQRGSLVSCLAVGPRWLFHLKKPVADFVRLYVTY